MPETPPAVEPLVVTGDDILVINFGPHVSDKELDLARDSIRNRYPDLAGRVMIVSAPDMAVIRRPAARMDEQEGAERA